MKLLSPKGGKTKDKIFQKIIVQEVADHINQSNDDFYNRVFEGIESERHAEIIDNFEKLVRAMYRQ